MKETIYILCNSAECNRIISSGYVPNLQEQNIFTCNLAYSHFRTNGLHFNMFADAIPIHDFLTNPNWGPVYDTYQYDQIIFVFNLWQWKKQRRTWPVGYPSQRVICSVSPVDIPASSAISALFYLNSVGNFDRIELIGYTINEWDGLKGVKELEPKYNEFQKVLERYRVYDHGENHWIYEKR